MYSYKIMAVKIIQVSQVGVISCGFLWCMLVEWITQCAAVTLKHMIETQESQAPHPQCNWPCSFCFSWVCWCLSIFSKTSAAITEMALTSCWRHFVFSELQIVVSVFVVIHYFNTDRIDGTKGGGITGVLVFLKQCSWVIRKLLKVPDLCAGQGEGDTGWHLAGLWWYWSDVQCYRRTQYRLLGR